MLASELSRNSAATRHSGHRDHHCRKVRAPVLSHPANERRLRCYHPATAPLHHVSGVMMRLAPTGEGLGRIGRLLEEGTIRPDVATVYALEDVAQAWKDIARNLPGVHGISPSGPGAARPKSHGKIVLRVA
jgi:hypothetical protein